MSLKLYLLDVRRVTATTENRNMSEKIDFYSHPPRQFNFGFFLHCDVL